MSPCGSSKEINLWMPWPCGFGVTVRTSRLAAYGNYPLPCFQLQFRKTGAGLCPDFPPQIALGQLPCADIHYLTNLTMRPLYAFTLYIYDVANADLMRFRESRRHLKHVSRICFRAVGIWIRIR